MKLRAKPLETRWLEDCIAWKDAIFSSAILVPGSFISPSTGFGHFLYHFLRFDSTIIRLCEWKPHHLPLSQRPVLLIEIGYTAVGTHRRAIENIPLWTVKLGWLNREAAGLTTQPPQQMMLGIVFFCFRRAENVILFKGLTDYFPLLYRQKKEIKFWAREFLFKNHPKVPLLKNYTLENSHENHLKVTQIEIQKIVFQTFTSIFGFKIFIFLGC